MAPAMNVMRVLQQASIDPRKIPAGTLASVGCGLYFTDQIQFYNQNIQTMKRNSPVAPAPILHFLTGVEKSVTTPLFRALFKSPLRRARHMVDILTP